MGTLVETAEEAARLLETHRGPDGLGRARRQASRPGSLASALCNRAVVTAEDGVGGGGPGAPIDAALSALARERRSARYPAVALGLPDAFLPQGSTDASLSELGLDGPGIAICVRAALGAERVLGRP